MGNTQQTWHHLFQIQHVSFQTTFMYTGSPYCHTLSPCHDLYTTTMSPRPVALHHPIDHPAFHRCLYSCVCVCVCRPKENNERKIEANSEEPYKSMWTFQTSPISYLYLTPVNIHMFKTVEVVYFSGNVKHSQSKNKKEKSSGLSHNCENTVRIDLYGCSYERQRIHPCKRSTRR